MRQISISISAVGKPKIEALGFNGAGCEAATKGIEDKLSGGAVQGRELKPEFTNVETGLEQQMTY